MNFTKKFLTLGGGLFSTNSKADELSQTTNNIISDTSCNTFGTLDIYNRLTEDYVNRVHEYAIKCFPDNVQRELFEKIMLNESFKGKLFSIMKFEDAWSIEKIVISAALGLLYGYAYRKTISRVKNGMVIEPSSFITFSLTSGGMVAINGILPGSVVYLESALLAGYLVGLHSYNILKKPSTNFSINLLYETYFGKLSNEALYISKTPNAYTYGLDEDERYKPYSYDPELEERKKEYRSLKLLGENLSRVGIVFAHYLQNGEPNIVNDELQRISGFTFSKFFSTWKNAPEGEKKYAIMRMLYRKGNKFEKVKEYLETVDQSGGYSGILFSMDTNDGGEVDIAWTTIPDGRGGDIRFGLPGNIDDELLGRLVDNLPFAVSKYDENGKPTIVNKKLQEISGFTFKDYMDARENAPEGEKKYAVMRLQYKGKNLEEVERYLSTRLGEDGYSGIAFTMDTNYGYEATLSWTTIPTNKKGGTFRFGMELTDPLEIRKELERTKKMIRTDKLTQSLNRQALSEDIHKIFTQINRKGDPIKKIAVIIDLDNFKGLNDIYGHDIGDLVLIKFADFINSKIRQGDSFYRDGGDEFVILFNSDDIDEISKRINALREEFYSTFTLEKDGHKIPNIGSSWGFKIFDINDHFNGNYSIEDTDKIFKKIKADSDYYMYAVKYFKIILPELKARGLDLSGYDEKNGQAYPIFNDEGNFIGVRVVKTGISFDLSCEELELINKRKKENADKISARK